MSDRKVCLLTGASGTLGTAICRLLSHKYDIAAVYRNIVPAFPSQNQQLIDPFNPVTTLNDINPIYTIRADIGNDMDLERVVEVTLAKYGKIDLLINNAVYVDQVPLLHSARIPQTSIQHFNINTIAPLKLALLVSKYFWSSRVADNKIANRNIINISSIAGLRVFPGNGMSFYSASKAALNSLSYHMAHEFSVIGVRVNVIAPNSFPSIIPTEKVVDWIEKIDEGQMNGDTLVLTENEEGFLSY